MLSITGLTVISMMAALILFCLANDKLVSKNAEGIAFLVFGALTLIAAENLQAIVFAAVILSWGAWCARELEQKLSRALRETYHHYAVVHKWSLTSFLHH